MIAALEALATRIDGLSEAVRREFQRLVSDAAGLLLDINKGYLAAGYASDGKPLQPNTYSPAYAAYKAKYGKNKQVAHVDLKLTEAFQDSFLLEPKGGLEYEIVATDAKYAFLSTYGDLLGIREADLDDFVGSILRPEIDAFVARYMD